MDVGGRAIKVRPQRLRKGRPSWTGGHDRVRGCDSDIDHRYGTTMRRAGLERNRSYAANATAAVTTQVSDGHEGAAVTQPAQVFDWPLLPWSRGPLSDFVLSALQREPGTLGPSPSLSQVDALSSDDFGLALYLCYELHFRNLSEAEWEWDPDLLRFRREMELVFEGRLRDEVGWVTPGAALSVGIALEELIQQCSGLSLSDYLNDDGTLDQFRELCVHRSAYHLREADPHAFGIPRLTGDAKAALVEMQYDDYGYGNVEHMHSTLFAGTMTALGLDASYGSYVENIPGVTLAMVNLTSMFALHRRWRAALVGHLAISEMTSVETMFRYSQALARFGVGLDARRYYDVHANADARHARIARDRLVAGLLGAEPHLEEDLLFGAAAVLLLEERFQRHLLGAWSKHRTSLIPWQANVQGSFFIN